MEGLRRWFAGKSNDRRIARNKARSRRRRQIDVQPLEERILLSAQSVLGQLADPSIQQLAKADYAAHQSITRADMLSIFTQVGHDHVLNAAEISSLRKLVSNASTLGMPGYVANLSNKVVNGDPANVYLKSAASPTGNIFAGCAASQLNALVGNWFEGFNPVALTNSTATMTWVNGVLFGKGGPKYTDIYQGVIGDCTLLAGLAETAAREPSVIQNMFIGNPDGTFTVRFRHNGAPDYVTVNTQLPNGGQLYDRVTNGVLWAALLEKAVVQENESGWLQSWQPGSNSYAGISDGDAGTTIAYLSAITGAPSSIAYVTNPAAIASAWQSGKLVVVATGAPPAGSQLVAQHAYALTAYNSGSSNPFTLFNPWGITWGQVAASAATLSSSLQFTATTASALNPPALNSEIVAADLGRAPAPFVGIVSSETVSPSQHVQSTVAPSQSTSVPSHTAADTDAFFVNWPQAV